MKLVYIVDFPIDGNSGKNKATKEKAKALKNKIGIDNFHFLHPKKYNSRFQKITSKLFFDFYVLSKILFIKQIDVVVQRVLFTPLTRFFLYIRGVKVISEYHADFKEEIPFLNKTKLEKKVLYFMSYFYSLNYSLSNGIIFNHPNLKSKFDKIYKKPSIYSYNGANTEIFNVKPLSVSREKLDLPNDKMIFLFLGSVSQWHGVDYLINIFTTDTFINHDECILYIVGGSENVYVNKLKKQAEVNPNIKFVPPVDNVLASEYISASNFCLLPAKQIRISPGSPLKLYDYIACGKAIITQDNLKGYSDEVENYNLGFTVDFREANSAAVKMISLTEDINYEQFESHNRNIAKTELSWNNRIDKWYNFIDNIS